MSVVNLSDAINDATPRAARPAYARNTPRSSATPTALEVAGP